MLSNFTRNDFEKIIITALKKSRTLSEKLLLAYYLRTKILTFQAFKINDINTEELLKYYTTGNMGIISNCLDDQTFDLSLFCCKTQGTHCIVVIIKVPTQLRYVFYINFMKQFIIISI